MSYPLLTLPAKYLAATVAEDEKMLVEYYKNAIRRIEAGEQFGLVLPDPLPEGWSFEMVEVKHEKSIDGF